MIINILKQTSNNKIKHYNLMHTSLKYYSIKTTYLSVENPVHFSQCLVELA
jgi:hypothetical protein